MYFQVLSFIYLQHTVKLLLGWLANSEEPVPSEISVSYRKDI